MLDSITWSNLTACKQMANLIAFTYKLFVYKSYIFNIDVCTGFGIK